MEGTIQFKKSVYEICTEYPEVKDILSPLGFADITKPEILNTVGRLVTIPKGASVRGIALSGVIEALQSAGFSVEGAPVEQSAPAAPGRDDRTALLREYVGRLSRGDDLEAVRKDFVAHFESVDAAEIARAEQELIQSGTPVAEVQRLCDVHSALFHGATREEQIANAEKAVQASADAAAKSAGTALSGSRAIRSPCSLPKTT
jgi:predicted RNase H-like HicB family nuclease